MPHVHLTDLAIQRLPSSDCFVTYWDESLPSFGIRCGKRSRTFVVVRGKERRRISLGRYPYLTLKEARTKAHALISGASVSAKNDAPKALYVLDQYFDAHSKSTRASTHKEARRLLARHFVPLFAERPINDITTNDLTRVIDALLHTPAEAIKAHAAISGFMNWTLRRQLIPRNPLAGMPLPAKPKSRDRVLSDSELRTVLQQALRIINTPYGAILIVLIFTGLRKSEAHQLRWSWITRETITIPKEIAKNNTQLMLPNTINGYLAAIPKTGDRLFPEKLDWRTAKIRFDKVCNFSGWVLHDLRRTLSTKIAEWEIAPPDVVEAILNHKSGSARSEIQRVYDRHSRLPQMRRALAAYADRLHALMKSN